MREEHLEPLDPLDLQVDQAHRGLLDLLERREFL